MSQGDAPVGRYNAAVDLIERNLRVRAAKVAFIDAEGRHTFADVADRSARTGAALLGLGLAPGDRVALILQDGIDFVCSFLGAIRAGVVPIPLNTLLPAEDYAYVLADSGARAAIVSEPILPVVSQAIAASRWAGEVIVAGPGGALKPRLEAASPEAPAHLSRADDVAFWLYSSGSTGRPKGTLHRHGSIGATAELFGQQVLGLSEEDIVYSAAKLFFAYGLGNSLLHPMYAGATVVLFPERVTPEAVFDLLGRHEVSVFCGVPTLYSALLASPRLGAPGASRLRLCLSAGEALPAEIGKAWSHAMGAEIVDGIGSTEMLHIFLSNRPGQVRYGTTGLAVPGYDLRLVGEDGREVGPAEIGELYVRGPSLTAGYWNQPEKTRSTFVDGWMRSGDKFERAADGYFVHRGRADDMLKVSGIWVSPVEVEAALVAHEAVLEAAVIGVEDQTGLVKTKAFVVLRPGAKGGEGMADALKQFIKSRLAPHKYPRTIDFVEALPKTATGKIRRHVLREQEALAVREAPVT